MVENKNNINIYPLNLNPFIVKLSIVADVTLILNRNQQGIHFEKKDAIADQRIAIPTGFYSSLDLEQYVDSMARNRGSLDIIICNLALDEKPIMLNDHSIIISIAFHLNPEIVEPELYIEYHIIKSVFAYHFRHVLSIDHDIGCPNGTPNFRETPANDIFCGGCKELISQTRKGPKDAINLLNPLIRLYQSVVDRLIRKAEQTNFRGFEYRLNKKFNNARLSIPKIIELEKQEQEGIQTARQLSEAALKRAEATASINVGRDQYSYTNNGVEKSKETPETKQPDNKDNEKLETKTEIADAASNSEVEPPDDMPVTLDTDSDRPPVGDKTENQTDELNHKIYADLFANMILNPDTATPLTIGLGAAWGRGKTFLAKQIRDQIVGKENIRCVWFNAWKHSKAGNIWIHFYTAIVDSLGINRSFWKRYKFIWHLFWRRHDNLLQHLRWVGPYLFGLTVLMSVFVHRNIDMIDLILTIVPIGLSSPLLFDLGKIASIIAIGGLIWKIIRPISSQVLPRLSLAGFDKKFASQEQILKNIGYLRDWQIKNCGNERVVVFVDDIDRCEPTEIVGILEAMQLFLENTNIVFILAMDTKVVRHAIAERYEFMGDTNNKTIGRQYLEKIIQIPFHIPEPTKDMFMKYAATLLHKDILPVNEGKEELVAEEPATITSEADIVVKAEDYKDQKEALEKAESTEENGEDRKAEAMSISFTAVSKREWEIVGSVLNEKSFTLSPRLLIRFSEIYFLSRNLILDSNINLTESLLHSYIAWLALSVKYPEESKALQESFVSNSWAPFSDENNFEGFSWITKAGDGMVDEYEIDKDKLKKENTFSKCDHIKVSEMMNLYIRHYKINNLELEKVQHIYNCFNLMLD